MDKVKTGPKRRRPSHPVELWMESTGLSRKAVRILLAAAGTPISEHYFNHLMSGFRRPKWPLARNLSEVTGGKVTPAQCMEHQADVQAYRARLLAQQAAGATGQQQVASK